MKTNRPNTDRPPRASVVPPGTEQWRVSRLTAKKTGAETTQIRFTRKAESPDVVVERHLTDEELDVLRVFGRPFTADDVENLLGQQQLRAKAHAFKLDNAPKEWHDTLKAWATLDASSYVNERDGTRFVNVNDDEIAHALNIDVLTVQQWREEVTRG